MPVDYGVEVHAPLIEIYGQTVAYGPVVSAPAAEVFDVDGIFERHHEIILDEMKGSELDAPGHSTTAPVLTVRLSDFEADPEQGDQITIGAETFAVWDVQPDGHGMADLILRLT